MKAIGKLDEGKLHVQFDVAGDGDGVRQPPRHSSTLLIITGASPDILGKEVRLIVASFLQERGLTLSNEKTKIVHIEKGFNFLGQNIRKYGHKLLIKPSKESCKSLLR